MSYSFWVQHLSQFWPLVFWGHVALKYSVIFRVIISEPVNKYSSEHHSRTGRIIKRERWAASSNESRRDGFDAQYSPPSIWICYVFKSHGWRPTKRVILLVNMRMSSMQPLWLTLTSWASLFVMPRGSYGLSRSDRADLRRRTLMVDSSCPRQPRSHGNVLMAQSQHLFGKTWMYSVFILMVNCSHFYTWMFISCLHRRGNPVPQGSPVQHFVWLAVTC